jgi:hypothetical protein
MALPCWIRRIFTAPHVRRTNRRTSSLSVIALEDRTVPTVGPVDPVYAPGTPQDYIDQIEALLEPPATSQNPNAPQYQINNRWTSTATNGGGLQQGDPTTLRWGFISDGLTIPGGDQGAGEAASGSNLIAKLDSLFGVVNGGTDLTQRPWFPIFANSFARISALTGITYVYEPNDDGATFLTSPGVVGVRPDVRIGGHHIDNSGGVLAYDFYPNTSDMVIDTDDLAAGGYLASSTNNFRAFRNVILHEHGHGLGLEHELPVAQMALMEPFAITSFDGPQFDDILALQRNYGDVYEKNGGNDTVATATPLGSISVGGSKVIGTSANTSTQLTGATATDFASIDGVTDTDVWSFSVTSGTQVTVDLLPVGPTYLSGQQSTTTSPPPPPVTLDAAAQSQLRLELLDSTGAVIASAYASQLGAEDTIAGFPTPGGGTFYVRISETQDAAQFYQLTVSSSAYTAPGTLRLDTSSALLFNDTVGLDDNITLQEDTANGRYVVTSNNPVQNQVAGATQVSATTIWVPFSAVSGTALTFATGAGNDTLTIDYSLGATAKPIDFDGGTGTADALRIVGGSFAAGSYTATGPTSGTLQYTGAGLVTFTNVEADVTDTATAAAYTVSGTAGDDVIGITDSPTSGQTRVTGTGGPVVSFENKAAVTVAALGGSDTVTINLTAAAAGLTTLTVDTGTGGDTVAVWATPTGLTTNVTSSGTPSDNDQVTVGNAGDMQAVLGPVNVTNPGGATQLTLDDSADTTGRAVTITPSSVSGLSPGLIGFMASDVPVLTIAGGSGDDEITILGVPSGVGGAWLTTVNAGGGSDTIAVRGVAGGNTTLAVNGQGGADTITVGDATGSLDPILGSVTVDAGGQTGDTVRVNDSGSTGPQSYALTATTLSRSGAGAITYSGTDRFTLTAGDSDNSFVVIGTGATTSTTISDGGGDSVWTITGDQLTGSNTFLGGSGADTFNLAAGSGLTGTAVRIDAGGDAGDAVRVTGTGGSDAVVFHLLTTAGDARLTGLGTALDLGPTEAFTFDGGSGSNAFTLSDDIGTSLGTLDAPDTGIVVRPLSATSAGLRVGTGSAPVMTVSHVSGLTVNGDGVGSGAADVVLVLGASTTGFGSAAGELTAANGSDTIAVSDSLVSITNASVGMLLPVSLGRTGGAVTVSGLVVDGGDEGATGGDTFTVTPSTETTILLDGGSPTAAPGDRLTLAAAGTARVFGDPSGDLVFEQTGAGGGSVRFRNFESTNVTSSTGRLELLGDYGRTSATNPAGSPAADSFAVTATGPGAGRFVVNGTAGLSFTGLTDLFIGTFADDDTIAVGVAAGWDVAVTVDGGTGNDRLDYTDAAGVDDTVDVAATGPGTGRIDDPAVTTDAFKVLHATPFAFTGVETVGTTANPGDADSLAFDMTAAGNAVTFRFDPTPGVADVFATGLFNLDTGNHTALTVNGGGGNDDFTLDLGGTASLPLALTINGDGPAGGFTNRLTVVGNAGLPDVFSNMIGANSRSGMVIVGGTESGSVAYTGINAITFDGGGGAGADTLAVTGTTGDDMITLTGTAGAAGTVTASGQVRVTFTGFGPGSSVVLSGNGGADRFAVSRPAGWGIGSVMIDGGVGTAGSVSLTGSGGDDDFAYTPSAGQLTVTAGGSQTAYTLARVGGLSLDGGPGTDSLTVTEFVPGEADLPSGTLGGTLPITYQGFEAIRIGNVPVAVSDAATTPEDTPVTVAVLANDTGTTDGRLTVTIINYPQHGTAVVNPDQTVTYTPAANYNGPDSFSYTVTDANGEGSSATVTLNVTAVNDPPFFTGTGPMSVGEGGILTLPAGFGVTDPDGVAEVMTVTVRADNGTLTAADPTKVPGSGTQSLTLTGTLDAVNAALAGLTYRPAAGFYGSDTITATVGDDGTGGAGGPLSSAVSVPVDVAFDVTRHRFAVGAETGGGPVVRVVNAGGDTQSTFFAYDPTFRGGVHVATGDLTGDGITDIVTGAGVDGAPLVNVFDGATGKLMGTFYAFDPAFRGGVHVAVGDVTGDGTPDIIVGAGDGGAPQVAVFDGKTFRLIASFYAFDPSFRGGVNVAAGDLDGDGRAEVVAGAGSGGAPQVAVFDGRTGKVLASYYAFDPSFRDGVNVAVGDLDGNGKAEVIAGAGEGGAPQVAVFAGLTGDVLRSFFAFGEAFRGGVSVTTADVNGDHKADLIVGTGSGDINEVRVLNGTDQSLLSDFQPFAPDFDGGVFVG